MEFPIKLKARHFTVVITGLCFILAAFKVTSANAAALPPSAPLFRAWSDYLSGTWNCRSGSTPYTVTYKPALGGRWVRGINTSAGSQSEDMLTSDPRTKRWTLFDMEPSGTWFAMHGHADVAKIRLADAQAHLDLVIHRINQNEYRLEFQPQSGKPPGNPDVCKRDSSGIGRK
jgi:hypothetical protein